MCDVIYGRPQTETIEKWINMRESENIIFCVKEKKSISKLVFAAFPLTFYFQCHLVVALNLLIS